jgi:outer membrane protein
MQTPSLARRVLPLLIALCCASGAVQAQDAALDRANQLLATQKGQGRGAFELLAPLEQQRAGEPAFDYALGLAAIDAGEYTRAVFALERVLAVQPGHPQARAEIARAYFLIGENRAARAEFETVRAGNPPPEVQGIVDRFLGALDARQASARSGITGFLETGIGFDSNVNSSNYCSPGLPGSCVAFNPGTGQRSGWYQAIGAGISGRRALNDNWTLIANGNADLRYNRQLDRFDTSSYGIDAGVIHTRGAHEFTGLLQMSSFELDRRRFRDTFGGLAQWRYNVSDEQQLIGYIQRYRFTHPDGISISFPPDNAVHTSTVNGRLNAVRQMFGMSWAGTLPITLAPSVFVGAYGGTETVMTLVEDVTLPAYNADKNARIFGIRFGGQVAVGSATTAFANASIEERSYGGTDKVLAGVPFTTQGIFRQDSEWSMRVGAEYRASRNWTIVPQASFYENRSNVLQFANRRSQISVTLRYSFR